MKWRVWLFRNITKITWAYQTFRKRNEQQIKFSDSCLFHFYYAFISCHHPRHRQHEKVEHKNGKPAKQSSKRETKLLSEWKFIHNTQIFLNISYDSLPFFRSPPSKIFHIPEHIQDLSSKLMWELFDAIEWVKTRKEQILPRYTLFALFVSHKISISYTRTSA